MCTHTVTGTASKNGTGLPVPTALAPRKSPQTGSRLTHQTSFASVHNNSLEKCCSYKKLNYQKQIYSLLGVTNDSKDDRSISLGTLRILSVADM